MSYVKEVITSAINELKFNQELCIASLKEAELNVSKINERIIKNMNHIQALEISLKHSNWI